MPPVNGPAIALALFPASYPRRLDIAILGGISASRPGQWFYRTINIHGRIRWYCICGQSPHSSRTRQTCNTVCQPRKNCYWPPVNGPRSLVVICSPNSSLSTDLRCTPLYGLHSYRLYPRNTLGARTLGSCDCISVPRIASYSIVLLFPFRYPMKLDTAIFGVSRPACARGRGTPLPV